MTGIINQDKYPSSATVLDVFNIADSDEDARVREVEQRLRVADRLAACIDDPRSPEQITHSLADIIRFRLLMISAGYEDGNDASNLRGDTIFKMALDFRRPTASCVRSRPSPASRTCPTLAPCCAWAGYDPGQGFS